jgi:uncharacterized repeat protein (TIGR03803 family)
MKHTRRKRLDRLTKFLLLVGLSSVVAETAQSDVIFQPFHHFFGVTGSNPNDFLTQPNPALIQATDGNLYGTVAVGGVYGYGFIFSVTTNGAFTTVYSFSGGSDGGTPEAALVQANDGNFYGTTADGGANYAGTVFRMSTNAAFTTLYSFTGAGDGAAPTTALVQAGDGNLYGATSSGAQYAAGTLFRVTTNGALTPLYAFSDYYDVDGNPSSILTQGSDGNLYGVFSSSEEFFYGEAFRLSTNGAYTTLYSFSGNNPNGLVEASDGNFYGTTLGGMFFRIDTNGTLTNLYTIPETQYYPDSQLVLASDGSFYGTTSGSLGDGEIFRITTNGDETEIYQFTGGGDGSWVSALVQARDGYLYGTTDSGGEGNRGTIFRIDTNGGPSAFTELDSFPSANTGEFPDGAAPEAGLTQASGADLYGSSTYGGLDNCGTIFRLGTNGSFAVLYSFTNGNDGSGPSSLTQGSDNNLYGTTPVGGSSAKGTIFRVSTNGSLTTLYSFSGLSDGAIPLHGLMLATDGDLYGTASSGGFSNYGTIFQFTTNSAFTLIYTFTNGDDGFDPVALAQASDGNLYGMAYKGGAGSNGTLFEVTTSGLFNVIHSFTGGVDGAEPSGASLFAANGYVYGTTIYGGGTPARAGTVFRFATIGGFSTLYSFTGGIDGSNPTGLAQGSDGNIYGTTQVFGTTQSGGPGNFFQISTNGTFSVVHGFTGGSDGAWPLGSLVSAGDGNIYGTTQSGGGLFGFGTIFRVVITSSNAPLPALQFPTFSAGNFNFGFQAAAAQSYFIQQTTNLTTPNWTFYKNLVGTGSFVQLSVPATNNAQFFRIREP